MGVGIVTCPVRHHLILGSYDTLVLEVESVVSVSAESLLPAITILTRVPAGRHPVYRGEIVHQQNTYDCSSLAQSEQS